MTVVQLIWKLIKILFTEGNLVVANWDVCGPELVDDVIIAVDTDVHDKPFVLIGEVITNAYGRRHGVK